MPNINYAQSPTESFVTKSKLQLPHFNFRALGRLFLIVLSLLLSWLLSNFVAGILLSLGGNISSIGLDIVFDATITLAYIATYYFLSHFYGLSKTQMYYYFLLALLLSFTLSFVKGAMMRVILPPILKKLKLLTPQES